MTLVLTVSTYIVIITRSVRNNSHLNLDDIFMNGQSSDSSPKKSERDPLTYAMKICQSIIQILPVWEHEMHPFWDQIFSPNGHRTKKSRSDKINEWLINECIRRFMILLKEHQQQIKQTKSKHQESKSKRSLIILDLDETIVYDIYNP